MKEMYKHVALHQCGHVAYGSSNPFFAQMLSRIPKHHTYTSYQSAHINHKSNYYLMVTLDMELQTSLSGILLATSREWARISLVNREWKGVQCSDCVSVGVASNAAYHRMPYHSQVPDK